MSKFIFKIDDAENIKRKRELLPYQKAQKYVDSEVIRKSDKYVPFDTGQAKNSAQANTKIGSGKVVYKAKYIRPIYYKPMRFQGAPTRGNYWVKRMADNGGAKEILQGVKNIVGAKKQ